MSYNIKTYDPSQPCFLTLSHMPVSIFLIKPLFCCSSQPFLILFPRPSFSSFRPLYRWRHGGYLSDQCVLPSISLSKAFERLSESPRPPPLPIGLTKALIRSYLALQGHERDEPPIKTLSGRPSGSSLNGHRGSLGQ